MLCSRFIVTCSFVIFSSLFINTETSANDILLNDTLITDFFSGVSTAMGKPIIVSKKAELFRITGDINLKDPYKAIEEVAKKTNLITYNTGTALYIYSSDELKSEFVQITTEVDFNDIISYLKLARLYDNSYPIRYTKGAAFVSGAPMYVKVVRDAVSAFYNGIKPDPNLPSSGPVPDVIKAFHLKNRFVSDMQYHIRGEKKVVEGALSVLTKLVTNETNTSVTIVADPLNNSLYLKGNPNDVMNLGTMIKEIDIEREQIQLSLWIIDIDSSEMSEIGTNLEGSIKTDFFSLGLNGGKIIMNSNQALDFVGKVNILETERKAKVLSRPILITQDNTPAVIDTNETIYVRLLGEKEVALQEITYGTILSVTPRVINNVSSHDIEMMVEIEDGNQTTELIDGIPNVRRSVVSTIGRIKNSESLLLGGFVRKEISNTTKGIPILKEIPIVKYLFSMNVERTSNVMRLFMIEPKIIRDPSSEFDRRKIIHLQSEAFYNKEVKDIPVNTDELIE